MASMSKEKSEFGDNKGLNDFRKKLNESLHKSVFPQSPKSITEAAQRVAEYFYGRSTTYIVGAGISCDAPSSLPLANEVIELLVDELLASPHVEATFKRLGWNTFKISAIESMIRDNMQLEMLFYSLQDSGGNTSVEPLLKMFEASRPNHNHFNLLSFISKAGHFGGSFIVTTNFDTLLEQAGEFVDHRLHVYASEQEFEKLDSWLPTSHCLLKYHGCVSKIGQDGGPIICLDNLGLALSSKKGKTLRTMLRVSNVIVLGYGGADIWDLYPLLFQAEGTVVWLAHTTKGFEFYNHQWASTLPKPRTDLQRLIGERPNRYLICGPTGEFIQQLCRFVKCDVETSSQEKRDLSIIIECIRKWAVDRGANIVLDLALVLRSLSQMKEMHALCMDLWNTDGANLNDYHKMRVLENLGRNERIGQIGPANFGSDDKKERLAYFDEAIAIARKNKWPVEEMGVRGEKAAFISETFWQGSRAGIYEEIIRDFEDYRDHRYYAFSLANLGADKVVRGLTLEGQKMLEQAIEIKVKSNDVAGLIQTCTTLAQCCGLEPWGARPGDPGFNPEKSIYYSLWAASLAYSKGLNEAQVWRLTMDLLAHFKWEREAAVIFTKSEAAPPNSVDLMERLRSHPIAYVSGYVEYLESKGLIDV